MLFRRIIMSAVVVGICAGLFLSLLQNMQLLQIILEAEQFESSSQQHSQPDQATSEANHTHTENAWAPRNGAERLSYTFGSNIIAAIGFAAILLALMSMGNRPVTIRAGFLWGLSGFSIFFLSPALGLPPELPGMQVADLAQRQTWWLMAVVCTAAGLACLVFAEKYYKALGLLLLLLPHIVGAPQSMSNRFTHPDAAVVNTLESLHIEFIQLASLVNFAYWLLLGLLSAILVQRYIKPNISINTASNQG